MKPLDALDRADWRSLMRSSINASRDAAAASLAGGIIAAFGRAWTPDEAADLTRACRAALYPAAAPGSEAAP